MSAIRIAAGSACFRATGIDDGPTASEFGSRFLWPRAVELERRKPVFED